MDKDDCCNSIEMDDPGCQESYDPLRWDHLYAIDLQSSQWASDLEVDRFEEVEAEEVSLTWPPLPVYDEEHAYPLRLRPTQPPSWLGLEEIQNILVDPSADTNQPAASLRRPADIDNNEVNASVPLMDQNVETSKQSKRTVTLDVEKIETIFQEMTLQIQPHYKSSVCQWVSANLLHQSEPPVLGDLISGPTGWILQILDSISSGQDHLAVCENVPQNGTADVTVEAGIPPCGEKVEPLKTTEDGMSRTTTRTHRGRTATRFVLPVTHAESDNAFTQYRCPVNSCHFSSRQRGRVVTHLKSGIHGDQYKEAGWLHPCDLCNFNTKNASVLRRHKATVHGAVNADGRPDDIRRRNDVKQYQTQEFESNADGQSGDLQQVDGDLETETATRQYACQKCESRFSRSDCLLDHIRSVHRRPGEKLPHACNQCDKSFKRKALLDDHFIGVHEGRGRFRCPLCPDSSMKLFSTRATLRIHQRRHHSQISSCLAPLPTHTCPICSNKLSTKVALRNHLYTQHSLDTRHLRASS